MSNHEYPKPTIGENGRLGSAEAFSKMADLLGADTLRVILDYADETIAGEDSGITVTSGEPLSPWQIDVRSDLVDFAFKETGQYAISRETANRIINGHNPSDVSGA